MSEAGKQVFPLLIWTETGASFVLLMTANAVCLQWLQKGSVCHEPDDE
jgi:hypothetical protein